MDVVCIGAANVDLVAQDVDLVALGVGGSEGKECRTADSEIDRMLDLIGTELLDEPTIGGSAFNVAWELANAGLDLRVGFVGAIGRMDGLEPVLQARLEKLDTRFAVVSPEEPAARCLSIENGDDRTLFTSVGVSGNLLARLRGEGGPGGESLVAYLAGARFIHVTSVFDHQAVPALTQLLLELRRANPFTVIGIDPGYVWTCEVDGAVRELLKVADYVFLNRDEMRELAKPYTDEPDEELAHRVLKSLCSTGKAPALVVLKDSRGGSTHVLRPSDATVSSFEYVRLPLIGRQVKDPTGAGDVFAAKFIACRVSNAAYAEAALGSAVEAARFWLRGRAARGFALQEGRHAVLKRLGGDRMIARLAPVVTVLDFATSSRGPSARVRAAWGVGVVAVGLIAWLT
jgi:sugar/nucleoside kinase (ribokinase family)